MIISQRELKSFEIKKKGECYSSKDEMKKNFYNFDKNLSNMIFI